MRVAAEGLVQTGWSPTKRLRHLDSGQYGQDDRGRPDRQVHPQGRDEHGYRATADRPERALTATQPPGRHSRGQQVARQHEPGHGPVHADAGVSGRCGQLGRRYRSISVTDAEGGPGGLDLSFGRRRATRVAEQHHPPERRLGRPGPGGRQRKTDVQRSLQADHGAGDEAPGALPGRGEEGEDQNGGGGRAEHTQRWQCRAAQTVRGHGQGDADEGEGGAASEPQRPVTGAERGRAGFDADCASAESPSSFSIAVFHR